jgi:fermentation-respiration switch protein FrsA (DUF1100 family)
VGETIADGMGMSVICSEDYPFIDNDLAFERNRDTYLGSMQTRSLALVCPLWPKGEVPEDFKSALRSETPILLLSGEADPVTPPENAELTLSELGSPGTALHLVAPGQGHVVIHRGCFPRLAEEFLEAGSVDGLDVACVDQIEPQAFFTTFAGPSP